jgi:hypothetical protein
MPEVEPRPDITLPEVLPEQAGRKVTKLDIPFYFRNLFDSVSHFNLKERVKM